MRVVQDHINESTITALHDEATRAHRKCGEASLLNPVVPPAARIAALTDSVGGIGRALGEGREPLIEALVCCAATAACWAQCWSGDPGAYPPGDHPDLRVLIGQTVTDLQYTAGLCARPGNNHCQLHNLPSSHRIALIGVDLGKVAGWLTRPPYEPAPASRAAWYTSIHGCLVHLGAGALMWAQYLEVSSAARPR